MTAQRNRPVCAITGATGGIGTALSHHAARQGYDLVLHGRSELKLAALRDQLAKEMPELAVDLVVGDLDTAKGTHEVAAAISGHAPKLDLLFNNAGVLLDGIQISRDCLEMHTQVNLIAPYILMQALRPNVGRAKGAIVNVSSGAALRAKALSVEALKRPARAKKLFGAYAQSKLAISVVTQVLGRAFASDDVTLASADPGPNKTEMTSGEGMPGFLLLLRPLFYMPPERGAAKVFDVAKLAKSLAKAGAYFSGRKPKPLPAFALAPGITNELLKFCALYAQQPGAIQNRTTGADADSGKLQND